MGFLSIYYALRYGVHATGFVTFSEYGEALRGYLEQQGYLRNHTVRFVQQGSGNEDLCSDSKVYGYDIVYSDTEDVGDIRLCLSWILYYARIGAQLITMRLHAGDMPGQYFKTKDMSAAAEKFRGQDYYPVSYRKRADVPADVANRRYRS